MNYSTYKILKHLTVEPDKFARLDRINRLKLARSDRIYWSGFDLDGCRRTVFVIKCPTVDPYL